MKDFNFLRCSVVVILVLISGLLLQPQQSPLEERLQNVNVTLTEIPGHQETVREWLQNDPAYLALADNVIKVIGDNKIIHPIPLEVINGKYKRLLNRGPADYITADQYNDLEKIKNAIYNTWKERHPDSARANFESILMITKQDSKTSIPPGAAVFITVNYPKESDEIPAAEFVGRGKVTSQIKIPEDTYIFSVIETNKYYRQDSQKLTFTRFEDSWIATWELDLILGRNEDIGLKGKLYLFVVDKENRRKLIEYYVDPVTKAHQKEQIQCIASSDSKIKRSIPE
jgi:hypothetical protein